MKIAPGQKIVCEADHVCGYFRNWVNDGGEISRDDLYLTTRPDDRPSILCEHCQTSIANLNMGRWEVRTEHGWIA